MHTMTSQVILASGELCPKACLQPGMMLLGSDAKPQELKGIQTRAALAFEVRPRTGEPFVIGADQRILAFSERQEPLFLPAGDLFEFTPHFQRSFSWPKTAIDFPKRELPLDPYFLGLLLGDGCFRKATICLTTPDTEIIEALYTIAADYQWPVSVAPLAHNRASGYYFKRPAKGSPSLRQILSALGLFQHTSRTKFIPKAYLFADRVSREALLAGLLDTDGSLQRHTYDYQTASVQLAEDIAFLAHSVGLYVVRGAALCTKGIVARLYLHGDFSRIPVRIRRKIASPRRPPFRARFKLKPVGIQQVAYLDIASYLQGDCTVRIGDAGVVSC